MNKINFLGWNQLCHCPLLRHFFLRRKRLLENLGNRTLFVTVWQMIFSILQYKQYSVFFHSPELKWNLHLASGHSAAFSVIPLFYWPSVIFIQQHYSVHSSESHTFTIFYSFIQIPDCKLSTPTPYLHHLFFLTAIPSFTSLSWGLLV